MADAITDVLMKMAGKVLFFYVHYIILPYTRTTPETTKLSKEEYIERHHRYFMIESWKNVNFQLLEIMSRGLLPLEWRKFVSPLKVNKPLATL